MDSEKTIDEVERLLEKAAKDLNKRIAILAASTDYRSITDEMALQRALTMRIEIAREMARFNLDAEVAVSALLDAAKQSAAHLVEMGIPADFTQADAELIKAMQQNVRSEIASASMAAQAGINDAIYVAAVTGRNKVALLEDIKQLLIGQTDKRGSPMINHAQTIFRTGYMEVDAVVQRKKANDAGIKQFKYVGGTVRDSRQWCIDHVGKVFTEDEVKAWESQQWQGKKAGDPFVVRGGWNCMHVFRAYIEEV